MTISEYTLRMEAYQLAQTFKMFQATQEAFINRAANATNKKGDHYEYKNPEDIFNYQEHVDDIRESFERGYVRKTQKLPSMDDFIRRQREYRRLKKGGN